MAFWGVSVNFISQKWKSKHIVCLSFLWWQIFFQGTRENIVHIFRAQNTRQLILFSPKGFLDFFSVWAVEINKQTFYWSKTDFFFLSSCNRYPIATSLTKYLLKNRRYGILCLVIWSHDHWFFPIMYSWKSIFWPLWQTFTHKMEF